MICLERRPRPSSPEAGRQVLDRRKSPTLFQGYQRGRYLHVHVHLPEPQIVLCIIPLFYSATRRPMLTIGAIGSMYIEQHQCSVSFGIKTTLGHCQSYWTARKLLTIMRGRRFDSVVYIREILQQTSPYSISI